MRKCRLQIPDCDYSANLSFAAAADFAAWYTPTHKITVFNKLNMASAYSYVVNRPSAIPYLMKPRSFNLTLVLALFLVLLNAMCIILSDQSYLNEKN